MEIALASVAPKPPPPAWFWGVESSSLSGVAAVKLRSKKRHGLVVKGAERNGGEVVESGAERESGGGYRVSGMEVTTFNQSFTSDVAAADFPVWDKIGAIVRLGYGIGNSVFSLPYYYYYYYY